MATAQLVAAASVVMVAASVVVVVMVAAAKVVVINPQPVPVSLPDAGHKSHLVTCIELEDSLLIIQIDI